MTLRDPETREPVSYSFYMIISKVHRLPPDDGRSNDPTAEYVKFGHPWNLATIRIPIDNWDDMGNPGRIEVTVKAEPSLGETT